MSKSYLLLANHDASELEKEIINEEVSTEELSNLLVKALGSLRDPEKINVLLRHGANPNYVKNGEPALFSLIRSSPKSNGAEMGENERKSQEDRCKNILTLLIKYGANLDIYGEDENPALIKALTENSGYLALEMLKNGASPYTKQIRDGSTAMMLSISISDEFGLSFLKECKKMGYSNIQDKNQNGFSLISWCAGWEHFKCFKWVVDNAKINNTEEMIHFISAARLNAKPTTLNILHGSSNVNKELLYEAAYVLTNETNENENLEPLLQKWRSHHEKRILETCSKEKECKTMKRRI